MHALELFNAGKLVEAIEAARDHVKSKPTDYGARLIFAELLCFQDEFERADKQLETVFMQSAEMNLATGVHRQLIRAATERASVFNEGAVPSFLAPIDGIVETQLKVLTLFRGGQGEEAAELLDETVETYVGQLACTAGDDEFVGFRDLDDRVAACLEVFTTAGKYYWIPWHRLISVQFQPVKRPRDLLWREASISVRQGPDAIVYVPTRYFGTTADDGEDAMLSRATLWNEGPGLATGIGQRLFAIGEEDELAILDCDDLTFDGGVSAEQDASDDASFSEPAAE